MNSKAITPIISVVLLMLITVIVATSTYYWMTGVQSSVQEDVQSNLEDSLISDTTEFSVVSATCEATPNNITVNLLNIGGTAITAGNAVVVLSSLQGVTLDTILYTSFTGIPAGELSTFEVESAYNIVAGMTYAVRVTLPNGKASSDSCTAE